MSEKGQFELIGHDCPLGKYPAPVVPIGIRKSQLIAVYLESVGEEPHVEVVKNDCIFTCHGDVIKESLCEFDYRRHRLFAFSIDNIVLYTADKEKDFFRALLEDESFASSNPFFRLSIAKDAQDINCIRSELISCIKYLRIKSPSLLASWYKNQSREIGDLWENSLGVKFPSHWNELLEDRLTISYSHGDNYNFQRTLADYLKILGANRVQLNFRNEYPFDVLCEGLGPQGEKIKYFFECYNRPNKLDVRTVKSKLREWQKLKGILDEQDLRFVFVSLHGHTGKASELAKKDHVLLWNLKEIEKRINSRPKISGVFLEQKDKIATWSTENEFWICQRPSLERKVWLRDNDSPGPEQLYMASNYINRIVSAADNPIGSLVILNACGATSNFMPWVNRALLPAFLEALLRYQVSHEKLTRIDTANDLPAIFLGLFINPTYLTKDGFKRLRWYLSQLVKAGIDAAIQIVNSSQDKLSETSFLGDESELSVSEYNFLTKSEFESTFDASNQSSRLIQLGRSFVSQDPSNTETILSVKNREDMEKSLLSLRERSTFR